MIYKAAMALIFCTVLVLLFWSVSGTIPDASVKTDPLSFSCYSGGVKILSGKYDRYLIPMDNATHLKIFTEKGSYFVYNTSCIFNQ